MRSLKSKVPLYRRSTLFGSIVLLISSTLVGLGIVEGVLRLYDTIRSRPEAASQSEVILTMPEEWARKDVHVEDASRAYYWHGKLHVFDSNKMRRCRPFPPKRKDVLRIVFVGDSMTYGVGVDEKDTYVRLVEAHLARDYRVEALNLGISGHQSEDVLKTIVRWVPELHPDIVIYGICLNDFLPSGIGGQDTNWGYSVPMPRGLHDFLVNNTLLGRLVNKEYDLLLRRMGLRKTFLQEIRDSLPHYRKRFSEDLKAINAFVKAHGAGPVIAIVLNHCPGYSIDLQEAAEDSARRAGMKVVPSGDFVRKHYRQIMIVSRWEGHANEQAHKAFSELVAAEIMKTKGMANYCHQSSAN